MPTGAKHIKDSVLKDLVKRVSSRTTSPAMAPIFVNSIAAATTAVPDDDDLEAIYASACLFAYWESWQQIDYHTEGIITVHYNVDGVTYTASFTKLG